MLIVDNVTKLYGEDKGIQEFTLRGNAGDIIALIGPNGSGKTTVMQVIAGITTGQQGKVLLNGCDTKDSETKSHIGFLPEELSLYEMMTVYEAVELIIEIKYKGKFQEEIIPLLKLYDLWEIRHKQVKTLSMGMRKKVGIIMATIGTPQLIILDEPTNGVDTKGIISLKKNILNASSKGSIVIISSHILDFVEKISTRNIFIKNGRIAEDIKEDRRINLEGIYEKLYL